MVSNHKKEAVYRFFGCIVLRRPFFISTSARDIFSISEIKEDDTSPALLVNQSKSFVHCNAENCGLSSWRMKYLTILLTLYQDKNWFMSLTDFKIQISLKWNLMNTIIILMVIFFICRVLNLFCHDVHRLFSLALWIRDGKVIHQCRN